MKTSDLLNMQVFYANIRDNYVNMQDIRVKRQLIMYVNIMNSHVDIKKVACCHTFVASCIYDVRYGQK